MLGNLPTTLKVIEMLPSIQPSNVRIEYDGKLFEGEAMLFLIALTNSVGGFEKLAPDALLNDGYFTLIILKKTNLADFVRVASLALNGNHINDPNIIYAKASHIKVTSPEEVLINLDGELGGKTPVEFKNLYRHIEVMAPVEKLLEEEKAEVE